MLSVCPQLVLLIDYRENLEEVFYINNQFRWHCWREGFRPVVYYLVGKNQDIDCDINLIQEGFAITVRYLVFSSETHFTDETPFNA